jgi:hypothetical protein
VKVDEHRQSREEEKDEGAYADHLQGSLETVLGPVTNGMKIGPGPIASSCWLMYSGRGGWC